MQALVIALLGLIGELVKRGAQAYADAQKQHDELIAAAEQGLLEARVLLDRMKSDHDARMDAARRVIAAAKGGAPASARASVPEDPSDQ